MKRSHVAFFFIFTLLFAACASPSTPIATEAPPPVSQEATNTTSSESPLANAIQIESVDPPVANGLSASDPIVITFAYSLTEEHGTLQVWFDSFQDEHCTTLGAVPTDPKGGSTMPGGLIQPLNGGSQTLSVFVPPIPPVGVQYIGVGIRLWNTEITSTLAEDIDYTYCYKARAPTVALEPSIPLSSIPSASRTATDTPGAPVVPPPGSGTGTGTVSGIVFADDNSNGMQDAGESGLASFAVTISDNTCMSMIDGAMPDSGGHYSITGVAPGRYCVVLQYSGGTPVVPNIYQVVDVSAGGNMTVFFGIQPAITTTPPPAPPPEPSTSAGHAYISINVYRLTSCDSNDRTPIPGVTVNLIRSGSVITSTTTASNGGVDFFSIPPGDYIVEIAGLTNCFGNNQLSFHLEDNQHDNGVFQAAP